MCVTHAERLENLTDSLIKCLLYFIIKLLERDRDHGEKLILLQSVLVYNFVF